jgi:hypothetical protein
MGPSEIGEVSKRKVTATARLALSSLRMEKTGEREAESEGDEDQGTDDKVEVVARCFLRVSSLPHRAPRCSSLLFAGTSSSMDIGYQA